MAHSIAATYTLYADLYIWRISEISVRYADGPFVAWKSTATNQLQGREASFRAFLSISIQSQFQTPQSAER